MLSQTVVSADDLSALALEHAARLNALVAFASVWLMLVGESLYYHHNPS